MNNTFDRNGDPRVDFYQWVNGPWIDEHPIPPDKSAWRTFHVLTLEVKRRNQTLLDELVTRADAELDSETQQLRDLYRTGMNLEERDVLGLDPIAELLSRTANVRTVDEVAEVVAELHGILASPLWSADSADDYTDNSQMVLWVYAAGKGMPDRDYYFDEDKEAIRTAYVDHVERMFRLIGWNVGPARGGAEAVMAIETALADATLTRAERRDPYSHYHPMTPADLEALAPQVNWTQYFSRIGVNVPETVVVSEPAFIERVGHLLDESSIDDWRAYLTWHLLHSMASTLSTPFVEEDFAFNRGVIAGTEEIEPLWERVLSAVDTYLGEPLGKLYVARYFPEEAKVRMETMIEQVVGVFADRIRAAEWMGDSSKEKALAKLGNITWKIAYPEKWRDYSTVGINGDSYAANVMRAARFIHKRELAKVGKPVDKTEWLMSPATVNAYARPVRLEMCFPAGALQRPFFDLEADDATNYGAIIGVIGHECTHISDDQGSKFDENGQLNEWWTEEDRQAFEQRAAVVREQYNAIEVLPGLFLNGQLTLGENIADIGGISLAFEAMQRAYADREEEIVDGLTPEQRVFIGWARMWAGTVRDEQRRDLVTTDPHAPGEQRVNVPFSNTPEFYEAFGIEDGDPMWRDPEERAKIW